MRRSQCVVVLLRKAGSRRVMPAGSFYGHRYFACLRTQNSATPARGHTSSRDITRPGISAQKRKTVFFFKPYALGRNRTYIKTLEESCTIHCATRAKYHRTAHTMQRSNISDSLMIQILLAVFAAPGQPSAIQLYQNQLRAIRQPPQTLLFAAA